MNDDVFRQIESIVACDPGMRGVANLVVPGDLEGAAHSLLTASDVVIVTGFYIQKSKVCETDGPPGARAIGEALAKLNRKFTYVTDRFCIDVCRESGLTPIVLFEESSLAELNPSHLLAIERPARAADGNCYSMLARDISDTSPNIDQWFLDAAKLQIPTIGIGDGGNEIGMGKVRHRVIEKIPYGEIIASAIPCDFLIAAGFSNLGAWGLLAAMSCLCGTRLLPDEPVALEHLLANSRAGAVDGKVGEVLPLNGEAFDPTVDGISWSEQAKLLQTLHKLILSKGL